MLMLVTGFNWWLPPNISTHGDQVDLLIMLPHWLMEGSSLTGYLESRTADHIMFLPDAHGHYNPSEHPSARRIGTAEIARLSNFGPAHDTYLGIYWALTGLHVLGGIAAIAWFLVPGILLWLGAANGMCCP